MNRIQRTLCAFGCSVLINAAVASCSDSADSSLTGTGTPGSGQLVMQLTDDPFPFSSIARVDVYVSRIDIRMPEPADGDDDDTVAGDDVHKEWVTVARPARTYDLAQLRNGLTADLAAVTLPAGTYHGIRFVVVPDSSSITLKDGTVLTTANQGIDGEHHGPRVIKVNLDAGITVSESGSTVVVVDFDLAHSFVPRGRFLHDGFFFRPFLRAFHREETGRVEGRVVEDSVGGAAMTDATVELVKSGTAIGDTTSANIFATTSTDSTGAFIFAMVHQGNYSLRISPPSGSPYPSDAASPVHVQARDKTKVLVVLKLP